jgi:hypothetical protein
MLIYVLNKAATAGRADARVTGDTQSRLAADLDALRRPLEEGAAGGQANADQEVCRILSALGSYAAWAESEFRTMHDHFRLLGEDNFRRYLPVEPLRIRVHADDSLSDVFCRAAAARAAGCRATVSMPPELMGSAADAVELLDRLTDSWGAAIEFIDEDDASLARRSSVARPLRGAIPRAPHDSRSGRQSTAVCVRRAGFITRPN